MEQHQDLERQAKHKPSDISFIASLDEEVQGAIELSEPIRKSFTSTKAKVVDMAIKNKPGALF